MRAIRPFAVVFSFAVSIGVPPAALASVLDDDPFVLDSQFNGGAPVIEAFHTPDEYDRPGRRVLRLGDGSLVVAAEVQMTAHTSNGSSIALARYAPNGSMASWPNAGEDDTVDGGLSLIWPSNPVGFPDISIQHKVLDLKRIGNRILVLYARIHPTASTHQIRLDVFDHWGARMPGVLVESASVLPRNAEMVPYRTQIVDDESPIDRVLIAYPFNVASSPPPRWEMGVIRYRFADHQAAPEPDNDFNSGYSSRLYSLPDSCANYASARHDDDLRLAATGTMFTDPQGTPQLYIANTLANNGDDDIAVLAIDGGNSAPITTFGAGTCNSGFRVIGFNNGSTDNDRVAGIAVSMRGSPQNPVIHVVASVARDCAAGIGITKLDHNAVNIPDFGNFGRVIIGGSGFVNGDCPATQRTHTPIALAGSDNRLAIVGYHRSASLPIPPPAIVRDDPFMAIVAADTGVIGDLRNLPVHADATSGRIGDGAFLDVVNDGTGAIAIAGEVDDERIQPETRLRTTLTRLVSDRIFGNHFE